MDGQKNRNKENENIAGWVVYFLNRLKELTEKLDKKYKRLQEKRNYLSPRQKKIKEYVKDNQPVKFSDIANNFKEINKNTLKKDLQYMKRDKEIKALGERKGTVYIVDDENVLN